MEEESFTLNYDHRHSKLGIPLDLSLLDQRELMWVAFSYEGGALIDKDGGVDELILNDV